MGEKPESRSGLIVGAEWASEGHDDRRGILSAALDWFRTGPLVGLGASVATIAGTILGFAIGLLEIFPALARQIPGRPSSRSPRFYESPLPPESKSGPPEDSP